MLSTWDDTKFVISQRVRPCTFTVELSVVQRKRNFERSSSQWEPKVKLAKRSYKASYESYALLLYSYLSTAAMEWFKESSLRKTTKFHLIFWCGNCAISQNFHTRKWGEISVFYAVVMVYFILNIVRSSNRLSIIGNMINSKDDHFFFATMDTIKHAAEA